jgi:hypothetical protein
MNRSPRRIVKRSRIPLERLIREPPKENQRPDGRREAKRQR